MILIGRKRGNGAQLARYLMHSPANDNAEVFDIRGTLHTDDIHLSLREMSLTSELTKSQKGLFHLVINPPQDAAMKAEDWLKCTDIIEKYLPFSTQRRVMVLHKKDHIHMHVAYARYDHSTGKMLSDKFFKLALSKARREIEEVLDQKRTPFRNHNKTQIKELLTQVWHDTTSGDDFIKLARKHGYTIVKSDSRRPFMVVDEKGRSYDLVRQLKGVRTKQVRDRLTSCKLEKDKTVIRSIRTKIDADYFDRLQENSLVALLEQKRKYDERQQELLVFKQKKNLMKEAGAEITDNQDSLSKAQKKSLQLLQKFRDKKSQTKQIEMPFATKPNPKLEKALQQLKEAIEKEEKQKKTHIKRQILE